MKASDRVDDRKISPAPTPDYSLKFLVNLPVSHLLHLDMSPHWMLGWKDASHAEEHNNNSHNNDKGDGHQLSTAGVGQALGSVLCVHQWFLSLREPAGESKQEYAGVPGHSN